jgi:CRP-like cAMP-binding protein
VQERPPSAGPAGAAAHLRGGGRAAQALASLQQLDLFTGLAPTAIDAVARVLRVRAFRRGETILGPRTPSGDLYLVLRGAVRISQLGPGGRELTVAVARPGQLFGVSVPGAPAGLAACVAGLEDGAICGAQADEFVSAMAHDSRLARRIVITLARQHLELEQQLEHLMLRSVAARLAQVLLRLAGDPDGRDGQGEPQLRPLRLTQQELAELVGTSRETVTRTLAHFGAGGLVEVGYRRLAVTDVEGLRREATPDGGSGEDCKRPRRTPAPGQFPSARVAGPRGR